MNYEKDRKGFYVVSLERGDDIHACVLQLAREQKITGAHVSAIGALRHPELGYYYLAKKNEHRKYFKRRFSGNFELAPLIGNISLLHGEPFFHAHVTISGRDLRAYAGHLFQATVAVVVEMIVVPFSHPLHRIPCADIGLARWEPRHQKRT